MREFARIFYLYLSLKYSSIIILDATVESIPMAITVGEVIDDETLI